MNWIIIDLFFFTLIIARLEVAIDASTTFAPAPAVAAVATINNIAAEFTINIIRNLQHICYIILTDFLVLFF